MKLVSVITSIHCLLYQQPNFWFTIVNFLVTEIYIANYISVVYSYVYFIG